MSLLPFQGGILQTTMSFSLEQEANGLELARPAGTHRALPNAAQNHQMQTPRCAKPPQIKRESKKESQNLCMSKD